MIEILRQSRLVLGGLLLLVGSVVLCPHATHEPVCEVPEAPETHDHASHDAEHDHGHCEFDTTHTHDFQLSSNPNLLRPPLVTAVVALVASRSMVSSCPAAGYATEAGPPDNPLLQLDSIRLLI